MFSLRLYAVIMASGNTFGNFSCRFEKWFLTTFDAFVAKPEYGTTNWTVGESWYFLFEMFKPNGWQVLRRLMKYCSISKRFLVANSSDSNVGHLKIGVIEQSEISQLNWLKWLATEVFLWLRISNRWLWKLCLRERFVWPMYCKPQFSHSIKYIKLFELQLMLVCILKVCLVAVLTISERGSKYS